MARRMMTWVAALAMTAMVATPMAVADEVDLGPVAVGDTTRTEALDAGLWAGFEIESTDESSDYLNVYAYVYEGGGWVDAYRSECTWDDEGSACHSEGYSGGGVVEGVTIDMEAGVGTIDTVVAGCAIQVSVTVDEVSHRDGHVPYPTSEGSPERIEVGITRFTTSDGEGTASGDACGWIGSRPVNASWGEIWQYDGTYNGVYVESQLDES